MLSMQKRHCIPTASQYTTLALWHAPGETDSSHHVHFRTLPYLHPCIAHAFLFSYASSCYLHEVSLHNFIVWTCRRIWLLRSFFPDMLSFTIVPPRPAIYQSLHGNSPQISNSQKWPTRSLHPCPNISHPAGVATRPDMLFPRVMIKFVCCVFRQKEQLKHLEN